MSLVLSLFPGIGLLDMAFEEEGFCVQHNEQWDAGPRYLIIESGHLIAPESAKADISSGFLVPRRDGLFSDASQTYDVRPDMDLTLRPAKRSKRKLAA